MGFPIFFMLLLAAIVVAIAAIAVSIQIYARGIGRGPQGGEMDHAVMAPPYKAAGILTIALLVLSGAFGYFAGYKAAYDRFESRMDRIDIHGRQTFHAEIVEVDDDGLLVQGIPENDASFRGEFPVPVHEGARLEWHGGTIGLSSLEAGDLIAITFIGELQEAAPATIADVVRIQLLEDAV